MTVEDYIEIPSFLHDSEVSLIRHIVRGWQAVPSIPTNGHFPNRLVSLQYYHSWKDSDQLGKILAAKLQGIFGPYRVAECVYQELFLPWDIHCDYARDNLDPRPWRSVLIPLQSADSCTILFHQTADYNDFWRYKQTMPRVNNPVDQDFWRDRLDFCWDDDREWLTVDKVSKTWEAGDLISFPRNRLHSSDNFHTRFQEPKRFLQILLDHV